MRVPDFKSFAEVQRFLVDQAKEREGLVKDVLASNSANHSVLLASPSLKTYEVTISDAGLLSVTLANDTALIPQAPLPPVGEAPIDGSLYGRKNAAWSIVPAIPPAANPIKNYIMNGAMMVSQENGTTAGTVVNYYPVDQFFLSFTNAGTQTVQQVASVTPSGSPNRLRITATVADASVAAGDFSLVLTRVEGLRVADLLLGSASAKTITIQFGVKAPAGTYCVSLRNAANNRSYIAEYVIASGEANTDVVKSVTIALDQTGTWLKDTGVGLDISWNLMCGSTYRTAAGTWTAGNFLGSANQFNFMGTASNVFELFDVGLYVGSVAPSFVVPDFVTELASCKRYWWKRGGTITNDAIIGASVSGVGGMVLAPAIPYPVEMRAIPVVAFVGTWAYSNASAVGVTVGLNSAYFSLSSVGSGNCYYQNTGVGSYNSFNARL